VARLGNGYAKSGCATQPSDRHFQSSTAKNRNSFRVGPYPLTERHPSLLPTGALPTVMNLVGHGFLSVGWNLHCELHRFAV